MMFVKHMIKQRIPGIRGLAEHPMNNASIYLDMNNCIQYLASPGIYYQCNLFVVYYMYYLNGGDCILPVPLSLAAFLLLTLWSESRWGWGLQGGISPL